MPTFFYITAEGLFYGASTSFRQLEDALLFISKILSGKSIAATFNALSQGVRIQWKLWDEAIWPFGDERQAFVSVYTFDLDVDLLHYSDQDRNLQIPLARFRALGRAPRLDEFATFQPSSPPELDPLAFQSPSWIPLIVVSSRLHSSVTRIMTDFGFQWRHILRRPYTDSTFRKFARSILTIAQLNFQIEEGASSWKRHCQRHGPGDYVNLHDVPAWIPYENNVVRLGIATLVLDQDLEKAIELTRRETAKNCKQEEKGGGKPQSSIYILLSVRHIVLCRADSQGNLSYTNPAALLDGINAPSAGGVNLLLLGLSEAFPCAAQPSPTRLHRLPIEIQDQILEYVSDGRIESARLACILGLGTPFDWMRKDPSRQGGPIEILLSPRHQLDRSPVETKIYFGDVFSGLSFR